MAEIDQKQFEEKRKDFKGYAAISLTDEYILDTWPLSYGTLEGKKNKILGSLPIWECGLKCKRYATR